MSTAADTATRDTVNVIRVDYTNPVHTARLMVLLDSYARDPMGGGEALPADRLQRLPGLLAATPGAFSLLALPPTAAALPESEQASEALGFANCFETLSTFAAAPLVNIHDIAVEPGHRGLGVSQALIAGVEAVARERGCCKITLEVLSGNRIAQSAYRRAGFVPTGMGDAVNVIESQLQSPEDPDQVYWFWSKSL